MLKSLLICCTRILLRHPQHEMGLHQKNATISLFERAKVPSQCMLDNGKIIRGARGESERFEDFTKQFLVHQIS